MASKFFHPIVGLAFAGMSFYLLTSDVALAEQMVPDLFVGDFQETVADFAMIDTPVALSTGEFVSQSSASHLTSASIAAISHGTLVVDADSGMLIRTDAEGQSLASLQIGRDASQLVADRDSKRAFVANRSGDTIAVVKYTKNSLKRQAEIKTHAEPYGVALAPDKKTLLVTTVADRQLSAYNVDTGKELWSIDIGPGARGVAISPSGKEAMVAFITTGAVARIPLGDATHAPRFVPLDRSVAPPTNASSVGIFESKRAFAQSASQSNASNSPTPAKDEGRRFSRGAFSATYVGNDMAIVPHQESTPQMISAGNENTGVYGGGSSFERPIQHRLAFVSTRPGQFERFAKAAINLHQPRAIRYDSKRDTLYVAGYGSDTILALADASKPSIHLAAKTKLSSPQAPCGPTGLDVADDGSVVAFCSLSRSVAHLELSKDKTTLSQGKELATSRYSASAQRGRALFRMGDDPRLSGGGVMACESCHPEVGTDGLSWRISGMALQTPLLAGKTIGTHPFKWDGQDKDIQTSLTHTVTRLGGSGINDKQAKDIAAFLGEVDAPRTPSVKSKSAVARGKKLFASSEVGCTSCHSGKLRTNRKLYELANDLNKVDTPALVGLASSAPYYHDGSATTLRDLLLENGSIHGMGQLASLSDKNVDDLVAYLKTL
jgi:DNA-binding beta-propeller fold protein YncE